MLAPLGPAPISVEARELQRQYAALVFLLGGRTDVANGISAPAQDEFSLASNSVSGYEEKVGVIGGFATPPLLAYLDGNQPLNLYITYDADGSARVALSVPKQTTSKGGPVTMVWPSKTIRSDGPLWIRHKSSVVRFEIDSDEAAPNDTIVIRWYHEEPREVHIGTTEIDPNNWEWNGASLAVRIPADCGSGPILVVTDNSVFQSGRAFRPTP